MTRKYVGWHATLAKPDAAARAGAGGGGFGTNAFHQLQLNAEYVSLRDWHLGDLLFKVAIVGTRGACGAAAGMRWAVALVTRPDSRRPRGALRDTPLDSAHAWIAVEMSGGGRFSQ
eukprot:gene7844-2121_t